MSLFNPPSTPGVVLASVHTLRPFTGSSLTARLSTSAEIFGVSVSRIGVAATTVIDSLNCPTVITTLVRTT